MCCNNKILFILSGKMINEYNLLYIYLNGENANQGHLCFS